MEIKDSGARSTFQTGAVRDLQTDKGRYDLLPTRALKLVAQVLEKGAIKYDARNWEKGIPLSRFMDSGLRHAFKHLEGHIDEPHLAQACWNFLCMLDTQERIQEGLLPSSLDDLPKRKVYQQVGVSLIPISTKETKSLLDCLKIHKSGSLTFPQLSNYIYDNYFKIVDSCFSVQKIFCIRLKNGAHITYDGVNCQLVDEFEYIINDDVITYQPLNLTSTS